MIMTKTLGNLYEPSEGKMSFLHFGSFEIFSKDVLKLIRTFYVPGFHVSQGCQKAKMPKYFVNFV